MLMTHFLRVAEQPGSAHWQWVAQLLENIAHRAEMLHILLQSLMQIFRVSYTVVAERKPAIARSSCGTSSRQAVHHPALNDLRPAAQMPCGLFLERLAGGPLKTGIVVAGISMASFVLGLRPMRASRFFVSKPPKRRLDLVALAQEPLRWCRTW